MHTTCQRCGKRFVPAKTHHRYCPRCYPDVAPMGGTTSRRRRGAPARRHGGVSRNTDGLRHVALRGDATSRAIVRGMRDFLRHLYSRPTQISTILLRSGMEAEDVDGLREQRCLNRFVLRFCPRLWQWLGTTIGFKARDVVIESYGLYGEKRSVPAIARRLGITEDHVGALRGWALKRLRDPEMQKALEALLVSTAHEVLNAYREDRPIQTTEQSET